MISQPSPQFYLAACDESTRAVGGYNTALLYRFYAYMMGNELHQFSTL